MTTETEKLENLTFLFLFIHPSHYASYNKKEAPVLGNQNELKILDIVAVGIDVKGKITPYNSNIMNAFYNSLDRYCYYPNTSLDNTMQELKKNVSERIKDIKVDET